MSRGAAEFFPTVNVPAPSSPAAVEHARWFAEQVQPYEPALRAYLQGRFPSLVDHDDILQDTYSRILRARASGTIRHPKAFLFTTARNAALDFFRRKRPISIDDVTHFDESAVLVDRPDLVEAAPGKGVEGITFDVLRATKPAKARKVRKARRAVKAEAA